MKAKINKKGVLVIKAKSEIEADKLRLWYVKNLLFKTATLKIKVDARAKKEIIQLDNLEHPKGITLNQAIDAIEYFTDQYNNLNTK